MLGLGAQRQLRHGGGVWPRGEVWWRGPTHAIETHAHPRAAEPVVFRKLTPALTRVVATAVVRSGEFGVGRTDRT